jgi:hypothetical protein
VGGRKMFRPYIYTIVFYVDILCFSTQKNDLGGNHSMIFLENDDLGKNHSVIFLENDDLG